MYFPLLRGKQFELLALRELSANSEVAQFMSPIIEPIKEDTTVLDRAIKTLIKASVNFNLVLNSCVVKDIIKCRDSIYSYISENLQAYDNFQIAINVNCQKEFDNIYEFIHSKNLGRYQFSLIHNEQLDDLTSLKEFIEVYNVKYNIINFNKVSKRYYKNFEDKTLITLEDHFNQQSRNLDYGNKLDEFFSEECFFYKKDGYVGFSDYLTIGEQYSESGFTPYAVVIHLTYPEKETIKIRHFISKNNNDTNFSADLPIKFSEALADLIYFIKEKNLHTTATFEFEELQRKEHYPGLGSVKKLSIMHHIELMCQIMQLPE
jgi:hypothetical protein